MSEESPSGPFKKGASPKSASTKDASGTDASAQQARPYDPEKLIGRTLAGRYDVERCIGKGGMGVVYLARQQALERKVVIKVLSRSLDDDDEASGRFEREAVGMSRLHHPNVVSIYDFGHADDQAYICMEFVDGETLSRRIKRDGAMGVDTFVHIAGQLLEGIGEAHSLGLIHRDIKPSNIMLTERHGRQDYVKILDFGLAKLVSGARAVTKEQSLVGSTAFLSPEQIMGNDIDQRVDVYALGVLFYYMLTGEKPFTADDDITVLYQHVHHPPPPLRDKLGAGQTVPAELVELINRMLAKDPDDRPRDAHTVHEELGAIINAMSLEISWEGAELGRQSSAALEAAGSGEQTPPPARREVSAGSGTQPSGQSFVTDEQMLAMQKANARHTMLIVLVAFVVFAGGFGAFLLLRDTHASAESVQAEISRAEVLVDQGKLGRAESVLELTKPDLEHHPSLKARFAASQDKLEIAKLFSDARFHEEQGEHRAAVDDLREILSRNPDQQEATRAIERLSAAIEQQEAATAAKQAADDAGPAVDGLAVDGLAVDEVAVDDPANRRAGEAAGEDRSNPTRRATKPTEKQEKAPRAAAKDDQAKKRDAKRAPEASGSILLPIGASDAPASEPSDDDVELLPIE